MLLNARRAPFLFVKPVIIYASYLSSTDTFLFGSVVVSLLLLLLYRVKARHGVRVIGAEAKNSSAWKTSLDLNHKLHGAMVTAYVSAPASHLGAPEPATHHGADNASLSAAVDRHSKSDRFVTSRCFIFSFAPTLSDILPYEFFPISFDYPHCFSDAKILIADD